ncbi:MAG: hypothetical protein AAF601_14970 [Pseudomonadota bacterium]
MTYNSSHALYVEQALWKMKPGDFFLISNGPDWHNHTVSHLENAAIRVVSGTPFGHGGLYLGDGKVLEMPIAAWRVRDLFAKDRTNGAAFVHCKNLNDKQRGRILAFARDYFKENKTNKGGLSYDVVSLSIGSVGELGTAVAKQVAEGVTGHAELGKIVSPLTQAPATYLSIYSAKVNEWAGNYPALSCVSLITYAHAVAGHIIDDGWFSYPTHTTPGVLWDIVQADKKKYSVEVVDFSRDRKDRVIGQTAGGRNPEWGPDAPTP